MMVHTATTQPPAYGEQEILFRTQNYQNGKMEETVYYRGDTVEISDESLSQTIIPAGSEQYNSIVGSMKQLPAIPQNKMFYETTEIMRDFYEGKLNKDEVRDMFKSYCYGFWGQPDEKMGTAWKSRINRGLSEMYEYFSRANTRAANAANLREGKGVRDEIGAGNNVSYYNSEYYFRCQEMQELFRCVSDELADEYGASKVDFAYVETNTKFKLDGGLTFNGVWDHLNENVNRSGSRRATEMSDKDIVPPKNFVYFACNLFDQYDSEKLNKCINSLYGIKQYLQQSSMSLASSMAEKKSLLGEKVAEEKNALLYGSNAFLAALSFTGMERRVEYCSIRQ